MADALPFTGPPCLMRTESVVTCSDASVSGGADAVSVEKSPRTNLKGGLANPKAGLQALSRRLMSPMVLLEAVWLQALQASQAWQRLLEGPSAAPESLSVFSLFQPLGAGLGP